MTDKKMACILLMALIAGMLYGTQQMKIKATAAKDSALSMETEASSVQQQVEIAQMNLTSIDVKTAALRNSYNEWVPHLSGFATPQEAEARITEIVRTGGVFLISQRFDSKPMEGSSAIPNTLSGDLVFEDDYNKTINWLGKLEESLPALRVTKCKLIRGDRGNNVNLELSVEVPIISQQRAVDVSTEAEELLTPEVASL